MQMQEHTRYGFLLAVVAIFALAFCPAPRAGSDKNSENQKTTDTRALDDGPHVFFQTDDSVTVIYVCDGEYIIRSFRVDDTLKFHGFCRDDSVTYFVMAGGHQRDPSVFDGVSRVLAISDIHGDFRHFANFLLNAGVIDAAGHWSWGDGHLVVLGDVFDRGDKVTESLWLIHQLEAEATAYGGYVHFVLGNHELMALRGDQRYVHAKYLDGISHKSRIRHQDIYGPDTELGRWLRSKPTAIRINDIIFVHGGISPSLVELGLNMGALNTEVLEAMDLRSSQVAFDDLARFVLGGEGPLWYRGYHYEMEGAYPLISPDDLQAVLDFYGGRTIVVGHTEVDSVISLHEGRVIAIDVPVDVLGTFEGILWDTGMVYRVTGTGGRIPFK
jgi:hypothetical protein